MSSSPRHARSILVAAALLTAAACSSDDSESASPVTDGVTETVAVPRDTTTTEVVDAEPPDTEPDPEPVESGPPATEPPDTEPVAEDPDVAAVADLPGAAVASVNEDGVAPLATLSDDVALPIVFVHGFAGSAQQYESQSMRFIANGYPADRIVAYDHDGAGIDMESYADGVDEVIDAVLADTGFEQVYLVGHSRGTFVSGIYLEDPDRSAKVAKYVAVDGQPCPADSVPCTAPNQENNPGQAHVEVATSKESFAMQYEFLVGEAPSVVDVEPQRAPVVISGRAVNFPENTGRDGTTLDVWAIDSATGARVDESPHASFPIGPDGEFGPLVIESGAHYEYVLADADSGSRHHLYLQPYVRSSNFVRLLSSPSDGPTRVNTNTGDGHSSLVVIRMREWFAEGEARDTLEISTDGGDVTDAIVDFVGNGTIGLHIHDDAATPGVSSRAPLPYFSEQPFQSGIDVAMPASPDGSGTITITNIPRGDGASPQTLNIPNWPSSTDAISVIFTDYPID